MSLRRQKFLTALCRSPRLGSAAGIAIGPILFIVAILAVLAAAIAAGSGSFRSGTASENVKAQAAGLIQLGQNLQLGFQKMISGQNADFASIVISPSNTSATTDLFSPTGGGIAPPSTALAATPTSDTWSYPFVIIKGFGLASSPNGGDRMAMLRVSEAICTEINKRAPNLSATPAAIDFGDPAAGTSGSPIDMSSAWPDDLRAVAVGCFENDTSTASLDGYYFYQVLGIR